MTMGLGDLVQKAVYLGIGVASLAGEKAGEKISELRIQVEKLADEMVERGEMTTDEARKFVDEMVSKAQQTSVESPAESAKSAEPRRIEIVTDEEEPAKSPSSQTEEMRRQVADLQEELRRLKRDNP